MKKLLFVGRYVTPEQKEELIKAIEALGISDLVRQLCELPETGQIEIKMSHTKEKCS